MVKKNNGVSHNPACGGVPLWEGFEREFLLVTLRLGVIANSFIHKHILRITPEDQAKFLDKVDEVRQGLSLISTHWPITFLL